MAEEDKYFKVPEGTTPAPTPYGGTGEGDNALQFFKNMLFSMGPELIGYKPDTDLAVWRANNPAGAFASGAAGMLVPYVGWGKVAKAVPYLGKAIERAGSLERMARAPVYARMQQELLRWTPLEAGRVGASALFGENTGDVFQEALLNSAIAAGFGAVGGLVSRGLLKPAGDDVGARILRTLDPTFDATNTPFQIQLRQARKLQADIPSGDAASVEAVQRYINKLQNEVIPQETLVPGQRFLGTLRGTQPQKPSHYSRYFFNLGENARYRRSQFAVGEGFKTQKQKELAEELLGLNTVENYMQYMQFPRLIEAKSKKAAQEILSSNYLGRRNTWKRMSDGVYLAREQETGLYVLAKRFGGHTGAGKDGDRYLVFKTDSPQVFVPGGAAWGARAKAYFNMVGVESDLKADIALRGKVGLWDKTQDLLRVAGPDEQVRAFAGLPPTSTALARKDISKNIARGLINNEKLRNVSGPLKGIGEFANEYLTPTLLQFRNNVRASAMWGHFRAAQELAKARADTIVHGQARKFQLRNIWAPITTGGNAHLLKARGLDATVDAAIKTREDEKIFLAAVTAGLSPAQAQAQLKASPEMVTLLKRLNDIDNVNVEELAAIAKSGIAPHIKFKPLKYHYGLSRTWKGDFRLPIYDERGRLVWMLGGDHMPSLQARADALVAAMKSEHGRVWKVADRPEVVNSKIQDLQRAVEDMHLSKRDAAQITGIQLRMMRDQEFERKFLKTRTGVKGFFDDFSKHDIKKSLYSHIEEVEMLKAEAISKHQMKWQEAVLADEDAGIHRTLMTRVSDLYGVQGPVSRLTNAATDRALGRVLGGNSATKISRTVNEYMFMWTLAFNNVGFALLNAMTPLMTALPEVAFLVNGAPRNVSRFYTYLPLLGADMKPRGITGFLDPMRVYRRSWVEMSKPDKDLGKAMSKAAHEGIIAPRLAEEYVGATGRKIAAKEAWKEDFAGSLKAVANFLPATSEEFARTQNFVIGWITARDLRGVKDPSSLYRIAKTFTERTSYLYSTADRARLMTGPMGSTFGLFKNWMMHYIGNWMVYAGEGITHGNFSPLLWSSLGAWSFGGLAGMGPTSLLVDGFARIMGHDNTFNMLYEGFGDDQWLADSLMYGLPGLLNTSLTASATAPGSEVMRDIGFLFNFAVWDRAKALGKAVGATVDAWKAGGNWLHPIRDTGTMQKWARALAPKTIYRSMQVLEDENLRSLNTGNPLVKDFGLKERILYSFGITPANVEKAFEISEKTWTTQQELRNQVRYLGNAWLAAEKARDWDELNRIQGISIGLGVLDRVMRSAATRRQREEQDITLRSLDKRYVDQVMRMRTLTGID